MCDEKEHKCKGECSNSNDRSDGVEAAIKYLKSKGKVKKHNPVLYTSWEMLVIFMLLTMFIGLVSFFIGVLLQY